MATRQERRERVRREREERERAALVAERRKKLRGYAIAAVLGVAAVAGVVVAVLSGGGDGAGQPASEAGGGGHVHGLGVNPADGAVFVASHNGLFRAAPGDSQARLVGTAGKDVMGFAIVGPNRFLGSGHPGAGEDLPSNLGLILSTDAGRTFRPVSLLGEADFHVLRSARRLVYGFDATNQRLMVSRDGGRTWVQHDAPAPVLDLVPDPRRSRRVLAATEAGLFASGDAGANWQMRSESVGLLAWPSPNRLYAVDGRGRVFLSADSGGRWKAVGDIGGRPAALLATAPRDLYVALHDGTIKRSANGGASWTLRSSP